MHSEEISFLQALREATHRGLITWSIVPHDKRDIMSADVDGDTIEIEHMRFGAVDSGTAETLLACVRGMKTYIMVSAGTEAYHLVTEITAHHQALVSCRKRLKRATARVQGLLDAADAKEKSQKPKDETRA